MFACALKFLRTSKCLFIFLTPSQSTYNSTHQNLCPQCIQTIIHTYLSLLNNGNNPLGAESVYGDRSHNWSGSERGSDWVGGARERRAATRGNLVTERRGGAARVPTMAARGSNQSHKQGWRGGVLKEGRRWRGGEPARGAEVEEGRQRATLGPGQGFKNRYRLQNRSPAVGPVIAKTGKSIKNHYKFEFQNLRQRKPVTSRYYR
jgi:hypothetical protein